MRKGIFGRCFNGKPYQNMFPAWGVFRDRKHILLRDSAFRLPRSLMCFSMLCGERVVMLPCLACESTLSLLIRSALSNMHFLLYCSPLLFLMRRSPLRCNRQKWYDRIPKVLSPIPQILSCIDISVSPSYLPKEWYEITNQAFPLSQSIIATANRKDSSAPFLRFTSIRNAWNTCAKYWTPFPSRYWFYSSQSKSGIFQSFFCVASRQIIRASFWPLSPQHTFLKIYGSSFPHIRWGTFALQCFCLSSHVQWSVDSGANPRSGEFNWWEEIPKSAKIHWFSDSVPLTNDFFRYLKLASQNVERTIAHVICFIFSVPRHDPNAIKRSTIDFIRIACMAAHHQNVKINVRFFRVGWWDPPGILPTYRTCWYMASDERDADLSMNFERIFDLYEWSTRWECFSC